MCWTSLFAFTSSPTNAGHGPRYFAVSPISPECAVTSSLLQLLNLYYIFRVQKKKYCIKPARFHWGTRTLFFYKCGVALASNKYLLCSTLVVWLYGVWCVAWHGAVVSSHFSEPCCTPRHYRTSVLQSIIANCMLLLITSISFPSTRKSSYSFHPRRTQSMMCRTIAKC